MIVVLEQGSYSDRRCAPAIRGPDGADLRALYGEFAKAIEACCDASYQWCARTEAYGYAKKVLGGKVAAEVLPGADEWHEVDLFAAWLVHARGWTPVGERRLAIDGDDWRTAWSEDR